jgi:hypothetical protein
VPQGGGGARRSPSARSAKDAAQTQKVARPIDVPRGAYEAHPRAARGRPLRRAPENASRPPRDAGKDLRAVGAHAQEPVAAILRRTEHDVRPFPEEPEGA